jgi:putative sigma-54 modulation protein
MQINLVDGPIRTTDTMRDFVQRKLHHALRKLGERVERVEVRVQDVNGPRGGVDKQCAISLGAAGLRPITVKAAAPDYYHAISLAAGRLKAAAMRLADRSRHPH